ncbi:hypothetical protein C1645_827985 [Glomus cerebriforme]|uniref:BTB/POZ domain-containing protein n=1 Tax=Glomus cerebriforme TaxID=658196 RepID=A0A397SRN2_9GLOM|nr:hypothetical protein C1645_827985 [Glomus cerebriforme]
MKKMKLNYFEILKNFEKLFESKEKYDVIIQVGKEQDMKEIYAHSLVLCCQSDYFRSAFSSNLTEKIDGKFIIKKPNISPHNFEKILRYLYCGKIDLNGKSGIDILELLIVIDELGLFTLYEHIQNFLSNNQKNFFQNDPIEILKMVFYDKALNKIQEFCIEIISYEPEILFDSIKFNNLPAQLLEIILKRDDLNLVEIEVWENLIKWGLTQEQSQQILNEDVSKWNQENFDYFQSLLQKFIPLIRFYEISFEDYVNKVKLYEEILPKELKDDILKFHMNSEYKPIIKCLPRYPKYHLDSDIINHIQDHLVLFANWIDKKEERNQYIRIIPYKFDLLYRASRDGITSGAFHNKCDNKGATIVIIKIKGSEQIIGGYNPFEWEPSGRNKSTTNSFIFSFTDRNNTQTAKVSYSNGSFSVCCHSTSGPIFGNYFYCYNNEFFL